jgi:hypothetical protein
MIGRGTRPIADLVDALPDRAARRQAIASSAKPNLMVLDFVGNSGRHQLISVADILGGKISDEVSQRAKDNLKKEGGDVVGALRKAEEELKAELRRRQKIRMKVAVSRTTVDPFGVLQVIPPREPGWHKGRTPTEKQRAALERFKIEPQVVAHLTFVQASALLDKLIGRAREGMATYKQAKLLSRFGESVDVSFEEASHRIDMIARNNWQPIARREPGED